MSRQERVLPSLTFDFNFQRVESPIEQQVLPSSKTFQQISHKGTNGLAFAKDHRYNLYHENIYSVLRSRCTGGVHGREDSSVELMTEHAQSMSEKGFVGLLRWMYVLLTSQSPSANSYP